jgi:uncharacterized membrane protein
MLTIWPNYGMPIFTETHLRSLSKTIVYRLTIIVADLTIVYLLTHRLDITLGVTFFTNVASSVLYYGHERVWNYINWGQRQAKP